MKFFLYCLCGGAGVIADLIVYFISLRLGIFYMYANALGYLSGTIISFILNRKITFGVSNKVLLRLAIFLCVALFGFSMSAVMLWFLINFFLVSEQIAKLFTLPVVMALQFFLNKQLTFNEKLAPRISLSTSK
jgi:putative flippase GtrA